MATATIEKPSRKRKFMGPAQKEFESFLEQSVYFLDTYWKNWKNYSSPENYVIPPVFNYDHPDVSDEAVRIVQKAQTDNSTRDDVITHRLGGDAEHVVYAALQQLAEEKIRAPFIAVHSLNINRIQTQLKQIFPDFSWDSVNLKLREHDFLIIGPNIGLVVIEVKSSEFSKKKDFAPGKKHLPDGYRHGVEQAESVIGLFHLLQDCTRITLPEKFPVRKILFAPNLERTRFDSWLESLAHDDQEQIEGLINDLTLWYKEDTKNLDDHKKKPPLYSVLRKMFEDDVSIDKDFFEAYTPIVAGLRSIVVLKGKSIDIELNTVNFSEMEAIFVEHERVSRANPLEGKSEAKLSKHSLLKATSTMDLGYISKVIFLSPDQQIALNGSKRQFIFGAAGTGKTVVLQAKALQLLARGQPVVVFAPGNYKLQYAKLFDEYGYKKYEVYSWPADEFTLLYNYLNCKVEDNKAKQYDFQFQDFTQKLLQYVQDSENLFMFEWLKDKNIFIDDACDERPECIGSGCYDITYFFTSWCIMKYVEIACSDTIAWTAIDSLPNNFWLMAPPRSMNYTSVLKTILAESKDCIEKRCDGTKLHFCSSILKRVMRCSEKIFCAAYDKKLELQWNPGTEPILGHKIEGLKVNTSAPGEDRVWLEQEEATSLLCDCIRDALSILIEQGVDLGNIAVVLGANNLRADEIQPALHLGEKSVAVHGYNDVSSFEWPIVIYAACYEKYLVEERRAFAILYPRYRAMTRATAKLIDISVVFDG